MEDLGTTSSETVSISHVGDKGLVARCGRLRVRLRGDLEVSFTHVVDLRLASVVTLGDRVDSDLMCHQAFVGCRLIADVVRTKVKVAAANVLFKLCHLSELCLGQPLLALVSISHRCFVQADKPVRHISLMLNPEVGLVIGTLQVFHSISLDRRALLLVHLSRL